MTASLGRRPLRRVGIALVSAAIVFIVVAMVAWWWVVAGSAGRPAWPATERAAAIASIISTVFGGISAATAVVALRYARAPGRKPAKAPGHVQVGRVPRPAAGFRTAASL